jgi:hypothetical protein
MAQEGIPLALASRRRRRFGLLVALGGLGGGLGGVRQLLLVLEVLEGDVPAIGESDRGRDGRGAGGLAGWGLTHVTGQRLSSARNSSISWMLEFQVVWSGVIQSVGRAAVPSEAGA